MQLHENKLLSFSVVVLFFWSVHSRILPTDIIVAKDGSGNFKTITEAIQAVPSYGKKRFHIRVKSGLYNEYLIIGKDKTNVTMFGDGMNMTVISGNRHIGSVGVNRTSDTATIGNGFIARDMAFQNVAGPQNHQAVALESEAENCAFFKCRFSGFQDTLYAKKGIQFFRECEIYGTVDFIFGDATAIFQNCFIYARRPLPQQSNVITASGRESNTSKTGTILHNCTVTSAPDLRQPGSVVKTYLGRPWKTFSRTVIMQTFLDSIIDPEGWLKWEGHKQDQPFYKEYNNRGPGADTKSRVKWSSVISASEATSYTVRNFINGESWIPSTEIPCNYDL